VSAAPRFELKYRLQLPEYLAVRNALVPHARLDEYSRRGGGRYFVRSLYFDTFGYRAYCEKMTGEHGRIKLRLRSYFASRDEAGFVCVEIKTRSGGLITKFAVHASPEQYDSFIRSRRWLSYESPVLIEFERLARLQDQRPRVLIDYEREAYLPRDGSGVRITFDHRVRAAEAAELFPASPVFRSRDPHVVILEIKTAGDEPSWLQRLARRHGLKAVPNSKYATGIEQTQHAVFS